MEIANIVVIEAEASELLLDVLSQVIYLLSSQPLFQRFILMLHSHFLRLPSDFLTKICLHSFLPILIIRVCSVSWFGSWKARDMMIS